VKEDRDLNELGNCIRQLAEPVGREAEQEAALGLFVDGPGLRKGLDSF
jgi:hypothetical protein